MLLDQYKSNKFESTHSFYQQSPERPVEVGQFNPVTSLITFAKEQVLDGKGIAHMSFFPKNKIVKVGELMTCAEFCLPTFDCFVVHDVDLL